MISWAFTMLVIVGGLGISLHLALRHTKETPMEIVPLTAKEDAEIRSEVQADLCGQGENACAPKCCMTREEAAADAEASIRSEPREFTAIKIDPDGGLKLDEPYRPMVDIAEPGWAPKMAEMLGGAHMSILLQAEKITNGQRQKDYGTALDNHERIARFWTAFVRNLGVDFDFEPEHVAEMMILMKIARIQNDITEDGLVDIAGYANVIDKMGPQRAARAARLADEL